MAGLSMKLTALSGGTFALDAGSMFGRVPKPLWSKATAADADNRMTMAARCLLVESPGRRVLIDSGIGLTRSERFARNFRIAADDRGVEAALEQAGVGRDTITDVIHTHLHFDHGGGTVRTRADGGREFAFPNAKLHVGAAHWEWSRRPPRWEAAGYGGAEFAWPADDGRLVLADDGAELVPGISLLRHDGHTHGLMMPLVTLPDGRKLLFVSDLVPVAAHVRLPYIMAFDIRPLETFAVKERVLGQAADGNWGLLLQHDATTEVITVKRDGADFALERTMTLAQWVG